MSSNEVCGFVYYTVCVHFQTINVKNEWWLHMSRVMWGSSLSLCVSHRRLECCQQQLLIKTGVLEPRTVYFSKHKHTFLQVKMTLLIISCNMAVNFCNDALCRLYVYMKAFLRNISVAWKRRLSYGAWKTQVPPSVWCPWSGTFPAVFRMFYILALTLQSHCNQIQQNCSYKFIKLYL